ncbi:imidazole glycerol phosphate synthase subunit HisF [Oceanobacillus sp. CAU 1775]
MTTKRIIPCLDIDKGRVVKGTKFEDIKEVADPVELAKFYNDIGADELVFYDITASTENRGLFLDLVKAVAEVTTIPLTVGGGIRTTSDIKAVLDAGADKVSINSAAIENPNFIQEASEVFGSDIIVFAMDVKEISTGKWTVHKKGGREDTGIDALEWAKKAEILGAGEIVVNVIDTDGVKGGYQLSITKQIADAVTIPVVASGGAGIMEHFKEVLLTTGANAALAASVFHFNEINIPDLKNYLAEENINVRRNQ